MHLYPRSNPLQPANLNSPVIHKALITYTDQRIDEIKKKYDTPNRRIKDDKENTGEEKSYRQLHKGGAMTEVREKQLNCDFFGAKGNLNSIDRCAKQKRNVEVSTFGLNNEGQVEKENPFSTMDNFHFKPAINSKLKGNQTDQYFFKPVTEQSTEFIKSIRCKDSYSKLSRRQYHDPRIDNIDKINSKIKRILDCIDDCQKEQLCQSALKPSRNEANKSISNSYLRRSINSNSDARHDSIIQLQQAKIIERQQLYNDGREAQLPSNSRDRVETEIPSLSQMRASHSNNQFTQYLTTYKNRLKQQENDSLLRSRVEIEKYASRSSSCYEKFKKSGYKEVEEAEGMGGKMDQINQEISKFQQKITQLQEQKRKLNIRFKPFYHESSPIKKLNASQHTQLTNKCNSSQQKLLSELGSKHKLTFFNLGPQISQRAHIEMKSPTKAQDVQQNQEKSFDNVQLNENESKTYDNYELRKKIGERMEQRRKRIEMYQQKGGRKAKQTIGLMSSLCQQVKLDEEFRNSKNWFSQCNHQQRLIILHDHLRNRSVNLTLQEIDEEFNKLRQDQSDPFFSFRQQKYTIESVADYYLKCTKHWKESLCHKWSREILSQQCFADNFVNQNEILIEDIVRLLNTQTGNFYRNRDLYLIYERLKKELNKAQSSQISVEEFTGVFS